MAGETETSRELRVVPHTLPLCEVQDRATCTPFTRCQERYCIVAPAPPSADDPTSRHRITEREFLHQVHQGRRARPPFNRHPPVKRVVAETTPDTAEDVTLATKRFQSREFTDDEVRALSSTFYYFTHERIGVAPRARSCTTETALRNPREPVNLPILPSTTETVTPVELEEPPLTDIPSPEEPWTHQAQKRQRRTSPSSPPPAPTTQVTSAYEPDQGTVATPEAVPSPTHADSDSDSTSDDATLTQPDHPQTTENSMERLIRMSSYIHRDIIHLNETMQAETAARESELRLAREAQQLTTQLHDTQHAHQQQEEEFRAAREEWAQTHIEMSDQLVQLTKHTHEVEAQHLVTQRGLQSSLNATTVELARTKDTLTRATVTAQTLQNEVEAFKAERDTLLQRVEDERTRVNVILNQQTRMNVILNRTLQKRTQLEKEVEHLRVAKAALEHAMMTPPLHAQANNPLPPASATSVPPNMARALSVYVDTTSQLSKLLIAPRTPRNLLSHATCVLRSFAATHQVFFEDIATTDRAALVRVLPEDGHYLALFMLFPEFTSAPLPIEDDLDSAFAEELPILFLVGMTLLHTGITPDLKIRDLVCFSYPCDVTMYVMDKGELNRLFDILQRLHRLAGDLNRAILESEDASSIPPFGFLWLVRAWQDAWDKAACTNVFTIGTLYFNWPVKIEKDDVPGLEWYVDISREYQRMTFEEARARALQPQDTQPPTMDVTLD